MAIAPTLIADARRQAGAQRRLQLLLEHRLDRLPNAGPDRLLKRLRTPPDFRFRLRPLLGIVSHRVILRHPPPSGRAVFEPQRRMMTRFLLFHHYRDTTGMMCP